nr:MAG TPA: hypothetical protein [Caudoviricetes sp.]
MFVYNISELLESLKSAQDEGFEYVSLSILDPDKEDDDLDCETVVLDYVHDSSSSEEDMIDAVTLPEGYSHY